MKTSIVICMIISSLIFTTFVHVNAQTSPKQAYAEGGTGIILSNNASDTGFLLIQQVIPNSPASKAGITPGEALMKVDTEVVWLKWPEYVYVLLAGNPGSKVQLMLWKNDHNYSVTLTREKIEFVVPSIDTISHIKPLPHVKPDQAFCDSFGRILDQAPDSFKKLHDNYIIYDHFDISGGGRYPYGCNITLPGSSYTNYIYYDSAKPCYFIATYQFENDSAKAWQNFITFSAEINQYLTTKTNGTCQYRYDINQMPGNLYKTDRIWDASYDFTLENIKNMLHKKFEASETSTQYISYYTQGKMWYYVSIRIWAI